MLFVVCCQIGKLCNRSRSVNCNTFAQNHFIPILLLSCYALVIYWFFGIPKLSYTCAFWELILNIDTNQWYLSKCDNIQLLTYVSVDMECYWTVNVILTDAERRSIWLSLLFITLHVYRNTSQQLFYYIINVCYAFPAIFDHKNVDVTDGSCENTWRSDVTSRKPVNIISCRVLCNVTYGKPCDL